MEKRAIYLSLFFMFILTLNFCLAVDITLEKSNYYLGETLQAEIAGNFIDNIQNENIGIYLEGNVHSTPVISNLVKNNGKYMYYAVLPENIGKYYVMISGVRYKEGSVEKDSDIIKNFTITDTNSSYLSFNPGFIYTSTDFEITIKAYNDEQKVDVSFPAINFKQSFDLGYGMEKTLEFPIDSIKTLTESKITINGYELKAIVAPKQVYIEPTNNSLDDLKSLIAIDPLVINGTLLENIEYNFELFIVNKQEESIALTAKSSNAQANITIDNFILRDEYILNLVITPKSSFNGNITLSSSEGTLIIPITIKTTKNEESVNISVTPTNRPETCAEFQGKKCNSASGETCSGIIKYASDGSCCIGTCVSKSSSKGWILGLLILVILGVVGYLFYKKSNNPAMQQKFSQLFKKKAENYEKRINPKPTEVRGNLTKD